MEYLTTFIYNAKDGRHWVQTKPLVLSEETLKDGKSFCCARAQTQAMRALRPSRKLGSGYCR